MLRRFEVQGFRCLKDLELDLEPFTVLVGPNGSGKTAILDALGIRDVQVTDFWRRAPGEMRRYWTSELARGGDVHRLSPGGEVTREPLGEAVASPRVEVVRGETARLHAAIGAMAWREQRELARRVCSLLPVFGDVVVEPGERAGEYSLRFRDRWDSALWYSSVEVPAAAWVVVDVVALQHVALEAELVCVDDLGRGLHPYLLESFVGMLRGLTTGRDGRSPVQVFVTTHSAALLEHVHPREARLLARSESDGATLLRAIPADDPNWLATYDESMSAAWLSGGLGGVP